MKNITPIRVQYIYSKTLDVTISPKNICESKIWEDAMTKDELPKGFTGFKYKVGFNGLVPIQIMKRTRVTHGYEKQ